VSSYAERLATELRNAYEAHSRDAFEAALKRMVDTMTYAGPVEHAGEVWPGPKARITLRELESANLLKGCTRRLDPCTCGSPAEQATCMHRRKP
jgi:hypothetical protein